MPVDQRVANLERRLAEAVFDRGDLVGEHLMREEALAEAYEEKLREQEKNHIRVLNQVALQLRKKHSAEIEAEKRELQEQYKTQLAELQDQVIEAEKASRRKSG